MQPFCHEFRRVPASLRTGKSQPVAAQEAFVRVRAQESLHQEGGRPAAPVFSAPPSPELHTPSAAAHPVSGWTKSVVAHHLKVLSARSSLPGSTSAAGTGASGGRNSGAPRHRRSSASASPPTRGTLQVPTEVFDALPGFVGLLRKMDLPSASVLRLQIALPLLLIADTPQPRQAVGVNQVVAVAQQAGDRPAPDFLHGVLLKKDVAPDTVFISRPPRITD